jgi:8-oxo-dGTP diphosphatase
MANSSKHIQVAVGVIIKNDMFFVSRRQAYQHQGNKWEFPGGKIDLNESAEQALCRELLEEIGIELIEYHHLMNIAFSYPDKKVSLHVFVVSDFSGQAHGAEGQESKWVCFEDLISLEFPDANKIILDKLAENRP